MGGASRRSCGAEEEEEEEVTARGKAWFKERLRTEHGVGQSRDPPIPHRARRGAEPGSPHPTAPSSAVGQLRPQPSPAFTDGQRV